MPDWLKGIDTASWWWIRVGVGGIVAAFVLVAAARCVWWFWWWWPKRQVDRTSLRIRDPKARADIEDNLRKTITQALTGIAVLIAAGIAYFGTQQTLDANRQSAHDQLISQQKAMEATQEQARLTLQADREKAEQADKAAHDQLVSQQVAKGFELLGQQGSDKMVLRLGGIYALEGVMNDPRAEQYRQPVLEALCAFVRERTKDYKGDDPPPADIQTILTVIGRRKDGAGILDLREARVPKARLLAVNLNGANLSLAGLSGADLTGASLSGASLTNAVLTGTNLSNVNLRGADLTGSNLNGANLSGATLVNAKLNGATLRGAYLNHGDLTGADLTNATLVAAILTNANLHGATLTITILTGANLAGSDLTDTHLGPVEIHRELMMAAPR